MGQGLVIVESPAKKKTIQRFLGDGYTVDASMGHVRDLPDKTMGVDIKRDFEPEYVTMPGKNELIAELRNEADKADTVYLATDPDREGEAISWHLKNVLGKKNEDKCRRITFNEITRQAVETALRNPRDIDMHLVDAQQGRRVIDRVVGYSISPVLWRKVRRGLSAGRVQSVALRMICERDEEIAAFKPEEYHTVEGTINRPGGTTVKAIYHGERGRKRTLHIADEAIDIVQDVKGQRLSVSEVSDSRRKQAAPWPFTTSSLQQDASRRLGYPGEQTMRIAQRLYEEGLITYLRTDSVRVSDEAMRDAREYIRDNYGERYLTLRRSPTKTKAGVQDAHEAIRPTHVTDTPDSLRERLDGMDLRLYTLIWTRFVSSRMADAVHARTKVTLVRDTHTFTASGSRVIFDGFLRVYRSTQAEDEETQDLSFLHQGDEVVFDRVEAIQHFTKPPAHFNDASLVQALEEDGIGRPSTYAPTIVTLLNRNYVTRDKRNLLATDLGVAVNKFMKDAFPNIVDTGFTARMEEELDQVAAGQMDWKDCIRRFYPELQKEIADARDLGRVRVAGEETSIRCAQCGKPMVIRFGTHGRFLGCSGFPRCKYTMPLPSEGEETRGEETGDQAGDTDDMPDTTGEICDKCGRPMVIKQGRYGKFLACSGYPECKNTRPMRPPADTGLKCPKCGGAILRKYTRKHKAYYVCESKDCDYISWTRPEETQEAEITDFS